MPPVVTQGISTSFSYWTACVAGQAIMHKISPPKHQHIILCTFIMLAKFLCLPSKIVSTVAQIKILFCRAGLATILHINKLTLTSYNNVKERRGVHTWRWSHTVGRIFGLSKNLSWYQQLSGTSWCEKQHYTTYRRRRRNRKEREIDRREGIGWPLTCTLACRSWSPRDTSCYWRYPGPSFTSYPFSRENSRHDLYLKQSSQPSHLLAATVAVSTPHKRCSCFTSPFFFSISGCRRNFSSLSNATAAVEVLQVPEHASRTAAIINFFIPPTVNRVCPYTHHHYPYT